MLGSWLLTLPLALAFAALLHLAVRVTGLAP
jgi:predicted outer membrane lipoprotein